MGLLNRAGKRSKRMSTHRALIIGGSGGIGRAVSYELAERGVPVVCHGGHDHNKIEEVVSTIRQRGGIADGTLKPLDRAQDVLSMLSGDREADIVVVAYGPVAYGSLAETSPETWYRLVETNLTLPGVVVSSCLPRMIARGWGRIVLFGGPHTASIRGYTEIAAYGAAKLGLSSLVRSAAVETRGTNVTVNAFSPGYVDTENLSEDRRRREIKRSPRRQLIPPERIATLICDIICAEESDVNGAVIAVDQGIV